MPPKSASYARNPAGSTSGPPPSSKPQPSSSRFRVEPIIAFYIFALVNLLAALYSPIQDCDEVYNYWEPTHYLVHKFGLQTWEYSPEFCIRSWLYVSLHAFVVKVASFLVFDKTREFYVLRTVLAIVCAYCESRLFTAISKIFNPRVGIMFMMVMLSSPGMFHASAAYLPSSFTMYTCMMGLVEFLDWRGGSRTHVALVWFGVGGIIGWPFASALAIPLFIQEIVLASITKEGVKLLAKCIDGSVRCMIAVILQLAVDTFFYHKLTIVPWNIIMYNIFSGSGRGPDAFGSEPADFYVRNLLLNFNAWFILALSSAPVLVLQYIFDPQGISPFTLMRSLFFISPLYMWLGIFSLQPHKEERFMYPAYPFIGLNAALALHALLGWFGNADPSKFIGKIPARLKLLVIGATVLMTIETSLLRSIGIATGYRAPLQIYSALTEERGTAAGATVCLGKEWYRFPSSYFLPDEFRVKFIKSEFNGLLPGEFSEAKVGFGFFPGSWLTPSGMNDQNIPDPGKYTNVEHCSYLVDSYFPGSVESPLEPNYVADEATWEKVQCERFLDAEKTGLLGRLLWLPDSSLVPERYRRKWGQYCLLRRREAP